MKVRTQLIQIEWLTRRAGRLAAAALLFFLLILSPATAAQEQAANQAGLVVQFGDGQVHTACVNLGPDGQATGEELLRASGLAPVVDYGSGMGGTVCKIGNAGCNFPSEKCFCQCALKPGEPCIYWSYFHLLGGQWRYSIQGADSYVVQAGDVEGWAWGPGTTGGGTQPPLIALEQICSAAPALLPTATWTAPPTLAATATVVYAPTEAPTDTPWPSLTPTAPAAPTRPVTPSPRPTQVVTATATPTPAPSASPTMERAAVAVLTPTPELPAITSASVFSDQASPGASDAPGSYVIFGALVTTLVIGLIVLRIKQQ